MESLKRILINRDGLTPAEADEAITEAQAELFDLLESGHANEAYEICSTYFNLEPDYIDDIISHQNAN